jgi:hypothetical protein
MKRENKQDHSQLYKITALMTYILLPCKKMDVLKGKHKEKIISRFKRMMEAQNLKNSFSTLPALLP